jgi:hypothetical protein
MLQFQPIITNFGADFRKAYGGFSSDYTDHIYRGSSEYSVDQRVSLCLLVTQQVKINWKQKWNAMNINLNRNAVKPRLLATISQSASGHYLCMAGVAGLCLVGAAGPAHAVNLYDGSASGNRLEINLTTTVSYSGFYRVNDPSAILTSRIGNPNGSEGDINFRHGIVGNLFQALPVLDIRDGDFGAHFSGELYLNIPYLGTNQNNQPDTINPYSIGKNTDFTSATRNVNGENARLLDAFVYGRHAFADDQVVSLKFGRQTLLWGQSLFFTNNGIAAGQAPIDILTAEDLANPQAQQVFMPVGQAVLTYHVNSVTVQGYYQFEWQPDNFQGVGAYFSTTDVLDKGGQRTIYPGTPYYFFRAKDNKPPIDNGQFGLSVQDTLGQYDLGLYALRYDAKAPEVYTEPSYTVTPTSNGLSVGNYQLVYPRDIQIYGASGSTDVGPVNVGLEISGRRNMPLVSGAGDDGVQGITVPYPGTQLVNASSAPLYAVGDTWAAQSSFIYVSPGIPFDPGGVTAEGEVEFNHVIDITKNRAALATGRQGSAAAFDIAVTPTYYDVLPNFIVTFPMSITYDFLGRSEIDQSMQHGIGVFDVGITGTYKTNWIAGLTYQDYLGKPDTIYNASADRGFLSLNLQHTF